MLLRTCLITASLALAACSDTPRGVTGPQTESAAIAAPAAAPAAPVAGVSFSANPATIRRCDAKDGNATVSLSWDVKPAGIEYVTLQVGGKVFANGVASGSAATGEWVRDDTVFTLLDAASKKTLATLQIPFVDC